MTTSPNTRTITFKKDDSGWYADVPNHTRSQNAMVFGADKLCDFMSGGNNTITITVAFSDTIDAINEIPKSDILVKLRRIEHDPFGATYWIVGKRPSGMPKIIWICNVTHDALNCDHPKFMAITYLSTYNV